jgi:hypothetical protein
VDDATAHLWADLSIQHPRHCVELSGQENSLLLSWEFVLFQEPVSTIIFHVGKDFTLCSPVGRILQVEHATGRPSRALVNLFFLPRDMPSFPSGVPAPPRNRMYVEYPPEVYWSNFVKWIPQVQLLMEAFVFLKSDVVTGSAGFCIGMETPSLFGISGHGSRTLGSD